MVYSCQGNRVHKQLKNIYREFKKCFYILDNRCKRTYNRNRTLVLVWEMIYKCKRI